MANDRNEAPPAPPARLQMGRTSFWELKGKPAIEAPIEATLPAVRDIGPATLTPRVYPPKAKGPRKGAVRYLEGGIYDRHGSLLPAFREREAHDEAAAAGNRVRNDPVLDREQRPAEQRLDGCYAYMGLLRGHFGHFLLESLCRLWFLLQADRDVRFLFHGTHPVEELPSFVRYVFDLLEIDPGRVAVVDKVCDVEHLLMPDSTFELRWKARFVHADSFAELFDRNQRRSGARSNARRVYLTRRQLDIGSDSAARKQVMNEQRVEELFAGRRYTVVAPEKLPFAEQVALMGGARHVAGLKGSALHMSLFCQQPDARVIQLDKSPSINQCLIDALKRMEAHHIICKKPLAEGGFRVDLGVVRRVLREL